MKDSVLQQNLLQLAMLDQLLEHLDDRDYAKVVEALGNASVGMHVRHILEFYRCLQQGLTRKSVCYDSRKRDPEIQTRVGKAREVIAELRGFVTSCEEDSRLVLQADYSVGEQCNSVVVSTSLQRELMYNLEHTIHHMAIIRIALRLLEKDSLLQASFGVAPSTLRSKNICAQ